MLLIIVVHIKICMILIHDLDYLAKSCHFNKYYMKFIKKIVAAQIKLSVLSLSSSTLNVYVNTS